MMRPKDKDVWKYCINANVKREWIDADGNVRHGTIWFPVGRKLYLSNRYWEDCREVTVMGLSKFRSKYVLERVSIEAIENIRCRKVFKPRVVALMKDRECYDMWWSAEEEDRTSAEEFATLIQNEQEGLGRKNA